MMVLRDDPIALLFVVCSLLDLASCRRGRRVLHGLLLLLGECGLEGAQLSSKFFKLLALIILGLLVEHHLLEVLQLFRLLLQLLVFLNVNLLFQIDHLPLDSFELLAILVGDPLS